MDIYEKTYREFRWATPEDFNFGNVIDHYAADPNRVALLWEDQDGNRARLTFADFKAKSNRIANVLAGLGLKRGDPILL
ncbi:MAG TPA: AMP-binding protein, partial [Candidatus Binataceae bacterium]|nr:AMP-binding protein [Candidatus Binataceae bacterium]